MYTQNVNKIIRQANIAWFEIYELLELISVGTEQYNHLKETLDILNKMEYDLKKVENEL